MTSMAVIKKSSNVEFDVLYADGSSHHVKEGVLWEVADDAITFHNGTNRASVLFAAVEAQLEVVDMLGLMPMLIDYLSDPSASDHIKRLRQSFSAEKQACFRLGQQQMREDAAALVAHAAAGTCGVTNAALVSCAGMIRKLETI